MTHLQKLQLEKSRLKEKMAQIMAKPERTDDDRTTLANIDKRMQEMQVEIRAAIHLDEKSTIETRTEDNEDREIRSLKEKVKLTDYVSEALTDKPVDGAARELRSALLGDLDGSMLPETGLVPIELLETRADAVTPVADSAVSTGSSASILQRVFTRSVAARLGVSMPTVQPGQAHYPVLLTGTTASMVEKDAEVDATPASFEGFNLEPIRVQARYAIRVEDMYRLAGLEQHLRRDLNAVMSDKLDDLAVNGNTTPAVKGFISELPAAAAPGGATDWNGYLDIFTSKVDGLNAYGLNDIRAVQGSETFQYAEKLFRTGATDNGPRASASEYVGSRIGGMSVSSRIPPVASKVQTGIISLTSYPGRNAVMPIWSGISILRDPYTASQKGWVILSATALANFKIVRETGYSLFKVQTSA